MKLDICSVCKRVVDTKNDGRDYVQADESAQPVHADCYEQDMEALAKRLEARAKHDAMVTAGRSARARAGAAKAKRAREEAARRAREAAAPVTVAPVEKAEAEKHGKAAAAAA